MTNDHLLMVICLPVILLALAFVLAHKTEKR